MSDESESRYHCGRGPGYPPVFHVQLRVGNREFTGEGATAQAAKHGAAGKALKMLKVRFLFTILFLNQLKN